MARVTLKTVADHVGVSRMTVSNAFSRPDQLSPALRARVLAAAEELGYTGPDPAARALAKGSSGAVGVLLFDSLREAFTDEVATAFMGAVAEALTPTGLALTLLTSPDAVAEPAAGGRVADVVPARDLALDGALVYSCDQDSAGTAWLVKRRLPLVMVDQDPRPGHPNVNIDDRGGARAAAQHLVDLGHRRIGLVTYSISGPYGRVDAAAEVGHGFVTHQRVLGWTDALEPAGIRPVVVRQGRHTPQLDDAAAAVFLDGPDPVTAVLCYSDLVAQGLVTAVQDRGLRVPDDLSVVGFDDSPLAARMRPALTTVRQDVVAKGRAAIDALTAQLGVDPVSPPDVVLPTELVVRDSTAPPRG